MMTLVYIFAVFGVWTFGKKVYKFAKDHKLREKLLTSKPIKRLGGRK